ncbi:MAG TPA: DUF1015 domain-containing protein [Candidatus Omnitrophota bacterium]|nr:DUF1015 domain-containing protein [Candidatus Omnitrophota bacterium]
MSEIQPFKALYYNKIKLGDLSTVVCPPYDVISPEQQTVYCNESEYNFVRIILGKDQPEDDRNSNKYSRAKNLFQQWQQDGVLIDDEHPSIYYYKQEYRVMGEKHSRLGFIALMRIHDDQDAKIFPHENTHSKAKEDRLKLWKSLSANLSPIFVCFSDKTKRVNTIFLEKVASTEPMIDVKDDDGVHHTVWRLSDPSLVQKIVEALSGQPLFIADGHHRYEVAKELRKQMREKAPHYTGEESFNFVMTYLTDIGSRDLKIFPMHRIIKKISLKTEWLEELFRIDKFKTKEDLSIRLAKAGKNEHAFGLYTADNIRLLRLRNPSLIDKYIQDGSEEFRRLDATILKHFILDRAGVASEDIVYTHDLARATHDVDVGLAEASFIMNPVKIQQLKAIALQGEKMPPKTTYFYPKVLSGLTIHKIH